MAFKLKVNLSQIEKDMLNSQFRNEILFTKGVRKYAWLIEGVFCNIEFREFKSILKRSLIKSKIQILEDELSNENIFQMEYEQEDILPF